MTKDSETFTGQLFVTNEESKPRALGTGKNRVDGSTYMQGPTQIGQDRNFSEVEATLMVGPLKNSDCNTPSLSLRVKGNAQVINGVLRDTNGLRCDFKSSKINVQGWKGFDIQHPSKENHRLRYICLEGPEGGVYIRGRVRNKTEIELPDYWKDLVDIQSITVSLTPIGAHQDVIVKRWDEEKIYLQARGGMPIDCFYHIFAERKDGEKLIVEYEGETPADYPGDPTQYSIAGYDYGRKE